MFSLLWVYSLQPPFSSWSSVIDNAKVFLVVHCQTRPVGWPNQVLDYLAVNQQLIIWMLIITTRCTAVLDRVNNSRTNEEEEGVKSTPRTAHWWDTEMWPIYRVRLMRGHRSIFCLTVHLLQFRMDTWWCTTPKLNTRNPTTPSVSLLITVIVLSSWLAPKGINQRRRLRRRITKSTTTHQPVSKPCPNLFISSPSSSSSSSLFFELPFIFWLWVLIRKENAQRSVMSLWLKRA